MLRFAYDGLHNLPLLIPALSPTTKEGRIEPLATHAHREVVASCGPLPRPDHSGDAVQKGVLIILVVLELFVYGDEYAARKEIPVHELPQNCGVSDFVLDPCYCRKQVDLEFVKAMDRLQTSKVEGTGDKLINISPRST